VSSRVACTFYAPGKHCPAPFTNWDEKNIHFHMFMIALLWSNDFAAPDQRTKVIRFKKSHLFIFQEGLL
jgi:hypothetical protein